MNRSRDKMVDCLLPLFSSADQAVSFSGFVSTQSDICAVLDAILCHRSILNCESYTFDCLFE